MASFQAIPKAKDLLDYTMERTTAKEAAGSTKPRFPKSQSFGYCKALRDAALSILERIQAANDYYFETQFEERLIALLRCGLKSRRLKRRRWLKSCAKLWVIWANARFYWGIVR